MSKFCAFILLFSTVIAHLHAQAVPRETVVRNGQTLYVYTVQAGEGLQAIARTFSVSVEEIVRHNPNVSTGLQLGQRIYIPTTASPTTAPGTVIMHTVVRGETLFSIAQRHNTTVADITRLNAGTEAGITEGQTLLIPQTQVLQQTQTQTQPQQTNIVRQADSGTYHVILPQETISSVARAHGLHPNDLTAANPGLSPETFSIGRIIRIPPATPTVTILPGHTQHVVRAGETLFSISRQYGIEIDDIVRANPAVNDGLPTEMVLQIPTRNLPTAEQLFLPDNQNVIRVGMLLPFNDESNNFHYRMQEYYEGFVLALEQMRNPGANLEILSFDIGSGNDTRRLQDILETLEWQSRDLIIGGTNDTHIRILADFARMYNIVHVVPFSRSVAEVQSNQQVFQVTQPLNILDTRGANEFLRLHRESNIIFVTGGQNNQMNFVNQVQAELRRNNIEFEVLASNELHAYLREHLSEDHTNVLVPTSNEIELLRTVMNELDDILETDPTMILRLFGYREWQTFTGLLRRFHRFGTHIFTDFYVNNNDLQARAFTDNFRRWFHRAPQPLFPNWAMLGYDSGLFFLTALLRHGDNFEQHLHQINVPTMQSVFHFERTNNWGGYINTGILLVHFAPDGTIHRIDRSRQ